MEEYHRSMPVEGQRSIAICRQCGGALAVRVLADGSIRPIGTGLECSCGGDSFAVVDGETDPGVEGDAITEGGPDDAVDDESGDEREYPTP